MTDCTFCQIISGKKECVKLFEDEKVLAFLHPEPASAGHIIVLPKHHYTIFEQMPDFEIEHIFDIANKLSVAVFDSLNIGGTNIIVNNGVAAGQKIPHFSIDVIPRQQGDHLNFEWLPKKLNEEEMSTVELKLKDAASNIGGFQKEEKKAPVVIEKKEVEKIKLSKEENYMIKQLERIP